MRGRLIREDDYRSGKLAVTIAESGDVSVGILNEFGNNGVTFCTAQGGGRSLGVLKALRVLAQAIEEGNRSNP